MRRRRMWSQKLQSADTPRRPPKKGPRPSLLRRIRHPSGHFYPKPKKRPPSAPKPPSGPRMRPKKSVVERVVPPAAAKARPNIRLRILGVSVAALFSLMLVRLWYLQVLDSAAYAQKVTANQVRPVEVPAQRGLIVDRSGNLLVGNQVTEDITLSRLSAQQHPEVVGRLSALLGVTPTAIETDINNPQNSLFKPVPILKNASMQDVIAIKENPSFYPGASAQVDSQLTYPLGDDGAQMLGYTRQITSAELAANKSRGYQEGDQYGQDGLEYEYEDYLHGKSGINQVEVNAQGQVVGSLGETAPTPGDDVITNIDSGLEQTLTTSLDNELNSLQGTVDSSTGRVEHPTGGAAVALDPQNGAVLALVSAPSYNPTIWESPSLTQAQVDSIFGPPNAPPGSPAPPAYNRAINGFYTPGSTFKLATATAALAAGLITPNSYYDDTGTFTVPDCTGSAASHCVLSDDDNQGAGYINVTTALTVSSDAFFYNLGAEFWEARGKYGETPIQDVANAYGYGEKTGIDLPGEDEGGYARVDGPIVDAKLHAEYPQAYPYGNEWYTGNNVEMAFGQGGTAITPIEQAVAYSTFANGGTRYQPEIAAGIVSPDGKVVKAFAPKVVGHVLLSPANHEAMLQGFIGAVQGSGGTATATFAGFPFDKMSIAGKTGTASASEQIPTSWFVGWGPTSNPQYLIAVVIENGGFGANAAAPVAKDGFEYLLDHPVAPISLKVPTVSGPNAG